MVHFGDGEGDLIGEFFAGSAEDALGEGVAFSGALYDDGGQFGVVGAGALVGFGYERADVLNAPKFFDLGEQAGVDVAVA